MNQVILGDCLEVMKTISDKSVDVILTDLPYGVTNRNKWDKIIDQQKLWQEWYRIKKETTPIILTSMQPFSSYLVNSNLKDFKYEIIWDKIIPTGFLNANKQPLRRHEQILVFYTKQTVFNPIKTKGKPTHSRGNNTKKFSSNYGEQVHTNNINEMKFPTSIINFSKIHASICTHPTEKPVELFEYLIKTYSNEKDIVIDCCAGSGTTAIACINTNRNYIVIEKDENYFKIIQDRINDTINPLSKYDSSVMSESEIIRVVENPQIQEHLQ